MAYPSVMNIQQCILVAMVFLLLLSPKYTEAISIAVHGVKIQEEANDKTNSSPLLTPNGLPDADEATRRANILKEIDETIQSTADLEQVLLRYRYAQEKVRWRRSGDSNACSFDVLKYVTHHGTCNYGFGTVTLCQDGNKYGFPGQGQCQSSSG